MTIHEVKSGQAYWCRVSGQLTIVRIIDGRLGRYYGPWWATNLKTGREVRVKSSDCLHSEATREQVWLHERMWAKARKANK